jgi:hypothetical protein
MLIQRTLTGSAVFLTLASMAAHGQGGSSGAISVGPNVQVSKERPNTFHYELWGGADLTNPDRLIVCAYTGDSPRNQVHNLFYVSHDRGKTWKMTLEVDEGGEHNGDPVCAFGPGGVAYAITLTLDEVTAEAITKSQTIVHRSADGGMKWEGPARFPFIDRESFAADNTGGKYQGRIYVHGMARSATLVEDRNKHSSSITMWRSLDGGKTFMGPAVRHTSRPEWIYSVGNGVVLSDGTYIATFGIINDLDGTLYSAGRPTKPNGRLAVMRSIDGGESFEAATTVAPWSHWGTYTTIPIIAVDPGTAAFKDRLYVAWCDLKEGRARILSSYSTDKGLTWSPPRIVDDTRARKTDVEGPDTQRPVVGVNKDGVVGISWYDRRNSPDNMGWDMYFAASFDGGETFTPSQRVSSATNEFTGKEQWPAQAFRRGVRGTKSGIEVSFYPGVNGSIYDMGDTNGMGVGADGTFHPYWVDNRTGVSQIWTAPVTARGTVARNGSSDLASLVDVSDQVSVDISQVVLDRANGTLRANIRVSNVSKTPISGPIKLRLVDLESAVGVPGVRGADNGIAGVGAVWDITKLVSGGTLAPGQQTQPLTVTYTLAQPSLRDPNGKQHFNLARSVFRVLAGSR